MLLHIVERAEWERAQAAGEYRPPSLAAEGFIHCSWPAQVLLPANERYRGRRDLLLLVIDPARIGAPLVEEDCYQSGQAFPHIYGPLPAAAVVRAVPFPPRPDGSFELPDGLA